MAPKSGQPTPHGQMPSYALQILFEHDLNKATGKGDRDAQDDGLLC